MVRQYTDEIVQRMEEMALNGCQNTTIAIALDVPKTSLIRKFGPLLRKKRCERKYNLRKAQTLLKDNNPAMAIFLGKNELGQVDKQVVTTEPLSTNEGTPAEQAAAKAAADAYKAAMARSALKLRKEG